MTIEDAQKYLAVLAMQTKIINLLHDIQSSRMGSIGSINNVYLAQLNRERIDNLEQELNVPWSPVPRLPLPADELRVLRSVADGDDFARLYPSSSPDALYIEKCLRSLQTMCKNCRA
jgi:hypothetical protein